MYIYNFFNGFERALIKRHTFIKFQVKSVVTTLDLPLPHTNVYISRKKKKLF